MIMGARCLIEDGGFALNLPKREKEKKKKKHAHIKCIFFLSLKKSFAFGLDRYYTLYNLKRIS